MGISDDLKRELNRRGWTVYRLAQESGIEERTIRSIIYKDSWPRTDTTLAIARGLGISLDEFLENPQPEIQAPTRSPTLKDLRVLLEGLGLSSEIADIAVEAIRHALKKDQGRVATQ